MNTMFIQNFLFYKGLKLCVRYNIQKYTTTSNELGFKIPKKIQRTSTDILLALSSTVGNDPTAAHYKYHDDPFLIPLSNVGKRSFALSQESGRKAARWIRQQNSELFQHSVAEPFIKSFAPKKIITPDLDVNEEILKDLINDNELSDAVLVYKMLIEKEINISNNVKQSLLELISFYNHEDPLPSEDIEERWFRQSNLSKARNRKTWKDGDLAEQLFSQIEPKSSESYCAIIRGMCKYFQVDRAFALFKEAQENNIFIDVKTYNSILMVANFLKESADLRWNLCLELLQNMKSSNLKPNLGTMNALLHTISTLGNYKLARSSALKVLKEFSNLNVEPSLATWYYILIIYYRDRSPISHVLIDIINKLEGKEFEIKNEKDVFFFVTAMDICRNQLEDKELAWRINRLLHFGNNYNLIGDSYKESIYYRHFFCLLCQTETLDKFMDFYDVIVPHIYIPEPGVMEEILKAVDINGGLHFIPKLWSDMVTFDHINRERLLNKILKIMSDNCPNDNLDQQHGLNEIFGKIALDIFNKVEEQSNMEISKLNFSAQMLSDILILLSRAEKFEEATKVFKKMSKEQHNISGSPRFAALSNYISICINNKSPSNALECLEYCIDLGFPSNEIEKNISDSFTLSSEQEYKLKTLLGKGFIEKET